MRQTALNRLAEISNQLPFGILLDIDQRVRDWVASGGGEDDSYIWQQVCYAEKIIAALRSKETRNE